MNSGTFQFSLQATQGLLWLAVLAIVAWAGMRVSWGKLVGLTLFLTLDLIMFGAFVRLSDSGLGCPDWPGCYGKFTPLQAGQSIAAEVAKHGQFGWVTQTKAWIEMIHRYWATFIGMLIVVMVIRAFVSARHKQLVRAISPAWPLLLLVVVIGQGVFGKLTVTLKLMPIIVTLHLLGGMLLFCLLLWFALKQGMFQKITIKNGADNAAGSLSTRHINRLKVLGTLALTSIVIQIALGGWVSTNYAAMACPDFPLCQGKLLPVLDVANGFDLSRDMGKTDSGENLSLQALTAIHLLHRSFAYVVLAIVGLFAWRLDAARAFGTWPWVVGGALLLQIVIGISTVLFNQPLLLAVAHNGGAALLLGDPAALSAPFLIVIF